jgi:hypothetical protein
LKGVVNLLGSLGDDAGESDDQRWRFAFLDKVIDNVLDAEFLFSVRTSFDRQKSLIVVGEEIMAPTVNVIQVGGVFAGPRTIGLV